MQMKQKTGLLQEMNHGCIIIINQKQSMHQCNGNILLQPRLSRLHHQQRGNLMLTVFWGSKEMLLEHFQKKGDNLNTALCYEVLIMLHNAIFKIRSGVLILGIFLLYDNARPHTA
uniref:Mos1 transposase HTH domain-containing protein n=1 Tax=Arion vulgaris TaxID=1028688 RepID=A0A0B6ZM36_9EUPU